MATKCGIVEWLPVEFPSFNRDLEVMMVYSHASSSGDVNGKQMNNYPLVN